MWRSPPARPGPDVVDVDHHGEHGSGFGALNRLKREGLVENPGAVIRTPSGGLHLYFTADPEHPQGNGSIAREHIDFRGAGGYVVAPPSAIGGRPYEVVKHEPSSAAVDFAAIRSLLDPQPERRGWQPRVDGQPQSLDHLVRYVAECTDHVNDRLYWAACRMAEAGIMTGSLELIRAAYDAGEDRRGQAEKPRVGAAHHSGSAQAGSAPFRAGAGGRLT